MATASGFQVVRAVAPTSGSTTQEITLPCGGLTPALVRVTVTRTTSVDTPVAGLMKSVALYDGTNVRCLSIMSENGVAGGSRDTGRFLSATEIINVLGTADETVVASADPTSLSADKLTIEWTTFPATALLIEIRYYYGVDLQAKVGAITGNATEDGTASVTSLGFDPTALETISGVNGFNTGAASGIIMSEGFCAFDDSDGSVQGQMSYGYSSSDRPSSGITGGAGVLSSTRIAHRISLSGTGVATLNASLEVTSQLSGGFEVTTRDGSATIVMAYAALRYGDRRFWCGFPTINESSTGTTGVTDPGFPVVGVICLGSTFTALDTIGSSTECCSFSVGAETDDTAGCILTQDKDNASTSVSYAGTMGVLGRVISDAGVTVVRESASSLDATGFTINVTTSAGFNVVFGYLALEDVLDQQVSPTGIASAEALGTPTITASITVSPTGIASAEALGTPALAASATVSPTGIASAEALGTPTIQASITVSPTGIASSEALGTPTLTATATVSPAGIASAEALGTPTVTASITVSPSGIASSEALGTPTVQSSVTVSPTGIASAEALGTPTVTASVTISPTGIASSEALGTPTVVAGSDVAPTGIASAEALGTPTIQASITVSPTGIASAEALGTPTLLVSTTILPTGIASAEALGTPTVTASITISPAGIASAEALGSPSIAAGSTISPTGIPSSEALGTPTITLAVVTVFPTGIASAEALGTPTINGGAFVEDLVELLGGRRTILVLAGGSAVVLDLAAGRRSVYDLEGSY